MTTRSSRFQFVSDQEKTRIINEIINFFRHERGEEIGVIAAENFLDFFVTTLGDEIYSKAIKDCQKLLKERFADLHIELASINPKS